MWKIVLSCLAMLASLIALDWLWLGVITRNYLTKTMPEYFAGIIHWVPAAIFYIIYIIGIYLLILRPNLGLSLEKVVLLGALFGLICYATYDLTNLSTLKGWPVSLVIIDIAWGALATGIVTAIGFLILK